MSEVYKIAGLIEIAYAEDFGDEQRDRIKELCAGLRDDFDRLRRTRSEWTALCIEARRVARSVATGWMTYLATGKLPEPAADVDTALAYPEQDSTKET